MHLCVLARNEIVVVYRHVAYQSLVQTMLFWIVFLSQGFLGQCSDRDTLSRPIVVGHRGTAYLPELTLASLSMAHAYGADIIEIDVCLSRDNQLIVIHGIDCHSRGKMSPCQIIFLLYRYLFECCE